MYDFLILGGDLEGRLIAHGLQKRGFKTAVLDSRESTCGVAPVHGWNFLPLQENTLDRLHWLENLLDEKVVEEVQKITPQTIEKNQRTPFLGFGTIPPPPFYDEFQPYFQSQRVHLRLDPQQWAEVLSKKFQGDFFFNTYITKVVVENNQIHSLQVNGKKEIKSRFYISCLSMKKLATLIPQGVMNHLPMKKINETRNWGAIYWHLKHSEPMDIDSSLFVLPVTKKGEETSLVLGQFKTPQTSQWMTLYHPVHDPEAAGKALNTIKKQIKNIFPEALNHIEKDKLFASEEFWDTGALQKELKLKKNQTLNSLCNLFIATTQVSSCRGVEGSIERSEAALKSSFAQQPIS